RTAPPLGPSDARCLEPRSGARGGGPHETRWQPGTEELRRHGGRPPPPRSRGELARGRPQANDHRHRHGSGAGVTMTPTPSATRRARLLVGALLIAVFAGGALIGAAVDRLVAPATTAVAPATSERRADDARRQYIFE